MNGFALILVSVITFPSGIQFHSSEAVSLIEHRDECELLKLDMEEYAYAKQSLLEEMYELDTEIQLDMECYDMAQLEELLRNRRDATE